MCVRAQLDDLLLRLACALGLLPEELQATVMQGGGLGVGNLGEEAHVHGSTGGQQGANQQGAGNLVASADMDDERANQHLASNQQGTATQLAPELLHRQGGGGLSSSTSPAPSQRPSLSGAI